MFAFISKENRFSLTCKECTALFNKIANTKSILNKNGSAHSYLWDVKLNSLTTYYLYVGNLFHTLKKVALTEADKTLAIEFQNNL